MFEEIDLNDSVFSQNELTELNKNVVKVDFAKNIDHQLTPKIETKQAKNCIVISHFPLAFFSIITLVVSTTSSEDCTPGNSTNIANYYVSWYLLCSGLCSLFIDAFLIVIYVLLITKIIKSIQLPLKFALVSYTFISIVWFIVGAMILISQYTDCHKYSGKIIYAWIVWFINAIHIIVLHIYYFYNHCRNIKNDDNSEQNMFYKNYFNDIF